MKKTLLFLTVALISLTLSACQPDTTDLDEQITELTSTVADLQDDLATANQNLANEQDDLSGTYVGYSWKGEASGTLLEDATQKVETTITLDADGIVTDASVLFWKLKDGSWYTRQDGTSRISVDATIEPIAATPGSSYAKGTSMFTIDTHDFMSLYAVEVYADGSAVFLFVDPTTRYQFEISLPVGYNYSTLLSAVTVNGDAGGFIPTVRTSGSGVLKPSSWSQLDGKNMFSIAGYNHVMSDYGVFEGITADSTMQELLEATGVTFTTTVPDVFALDYGRHSIGGWEGNYQAIEAFLIGKDVTSVTSLVDWSVTKWGDSINEDNYFGIDLVAGSTKTAQDSFDTISGATVRMSRESTSFQRALVAAGILDESDVIVGRF
ncbi:hypothetical protein KQ51_00786 [Candidatus Izimaplasma bacterium HR1]|jgi:hypothetical protein|uniref:hypothetical protein n=1 Tax=Candidatus Izimoplasma sp. HR1 TaxID=1541959 RepID=UPI0004F6CC88|nr:hypothetical protein KQ51_00786 [Candidatus Izimaplasma bacterium HR1]